MSLDIRQGDCLEVLQTLPAGFARTCVTSPPYWGLRDYGHEAQIGLEATPDAYVARLLDVFREVRRVLTDDGTLWLNLGDSYATGAGKVGDCPGGGEQGERWKGGEGRGYRGDRLANGRGDSPAVLRKKTRATRDGSHAGKHTAMAALGPMTQPNRMPLPGLKPKDLIGVPWRVAFALQSDGWWLRSDIVWAKPNPMPESVTDRPTKAHEYVFLLAKRGSYYYDAKAIREADVGADHPRNVLHRPEPTGGLMSPHAGIRRADGRNGEGRNRRTVWTVATQPFAEAHFATFPEALVEPCILAGSAPGDLVIDPFAGAGTVGVVALRYGRRFLGIELNPGYCEMARRRIAGPLFADEGAPA